MHRQKAKVKIHGFCHFLIDNPFLLMQTLQGSQGTGDPSKMTCGTDVSNIKAW